MKKNSKKLSRNSSPSQSKRLTPKKPKVLTAEQRNKSIYELYNLCAKSPDSWAGVPETTPQRHLSAFLGSLKRVLIPDTHTPRQALPEAADGLQQFIAIHNGCRYYVDTGANDYCRYVLRIFEGKDSVKFSLKVGDVFWAQGYGGVIVSKIFQSGEEECEIIYSCKKIVNK